MPKLARAVATLLSLSPALLAVAHLALDLAVPPAHAPAAPQKGPPQIIGPLPRGGAPVRIVLPKADSPYDTARLRSVTWGTSPVATIQVCCGTSCVNTRTSVKDWGAVLLHLPACAPGAEIAVRVIEATGGSVGWVGIDGVPDIRPVLSRSWSRPLQRARAYFALAGCDAFLPSALAFLFVTAAAVALALSPNRAPP